MKPSACCKKQIAYNYEHSITPTTIIKGKESIMEQAGLGDSRSTKAKIYLANTEAENASIAAESASEYKTVPMLEEEIKRTKKAMEKAAKEMDFIEAARLRDYIQALQKNLNGKK